jgi:hypothetical protein
MYQLVPTPDSFNSVFFLVRDRPREIVSWVSNTEKSSFYTLSIAGTPIYRVNYPVRLHRWYHSCQSWNGRTGEWQLWVNSERVGRGFYNIVSIIHSKTKIYYKS